MPPKIHPPEQTVVDTALSEGTKCKLRLAETSLILSFFEKNVSWDSFLSHPVFALSYWKAQ